jgi:hypothetical protein
LYLNHTYRLAQLIQDVKHFAKQCLRKIPTGGQIMKKVCAFALLTVVIFASSAFALTPAEQAALRSINPENKPCYNCGAPLPPQPKYDGKATINPLGTPLLQDYSAEVWVGWAPGQSEAALRLPGLPEIIDGKYCTDLHVGHEPP